MVSSSASVIVLEYVCPALGLITGHLMFFAPVLDVRKAITHDGTNTSAGDLLGDLNPTPWAFMLGNCCGWVAYAFIIQNLWVFFANVAGFILSVWLNMQAIKLQYGAYQSKQIRTSIVAALHDHHEQQSRRSIQPYHQQQEDQQQQKKKGSSTSDTGAVAAAAVADSETDRPSQSSHSSNNNQQVITTDEEAPPILGAGAPLFDFAKIVWDVTAQNTQAPVLHEWLVMMFVVLWVAIIATVAFSQDALSTGTHELIVGVTVNLNLVFFYGAPLSTIVTVIKTRSTATIHIPTMITNTANGVFWTAYGVAVKDLFIAVPNGLGAVLGGIQIFLCVVFPRKPQVVATSAGVSTSSSTSAASVATPSEKSTACSPDDDNNVVNNGDDYR